MINETGRLILSHLLSQNEVISSKRLADFCNLSLSTIRTEIQSLNDEIKEYGLHIESKRSAGCQLIIENEDEAQALFESLKFKLQRKLFNSRNHQYRSDYIIRRLLISKKPITMDKLSDELYYSSSTIVRDINQAREMLKRYRLTIKLKKNVGFTIEGDEFDKRLHLLIQHKKFIYLDEIKKKTEYNFNTYFYTDSPIHNQIRNELIQVLKDYPELEYSYLDVPKISNFIIIMKHRHDYSNKMILNNEQLRLIQESTAYKCAKATLIKVHHFLEFEANEQEILSLARVLLGYISLSSLNQIAPSKKELLLNETSDILNELIESEKLNPVFFNEAVYSDFACILEKIKTKLILKIPFDMESFYPIIDKGSLNMDCCARLMYIMHKRGYKSFDQQCALSYLYLFNRIFTNPMESLFSLNIIVFSIYGIENSKTIAQNLHRHFSNNIQTIQAIEYVTGEALNLDEADLILTDLFSLQEKTTTPVISLDLSNTKALHLAVENYLTACLKEKMSNFIHHHTYSTKFKEKEEIFNYIAKLHHTEIPDKKAFIHDLKIRDENISATRKNELAFITTADYPITKTTFDIFINNKPILYNNKKTQFIIFYTHNKEKSEDSRLINTLLNRLLSKTPNQMQSLLDCKQNIIEFLIED